MTLRDYEVTQLRSNDTSAARASVLCRFVISQFRNLVVSAVVLLAGCGSVLSTYDVAPNGLLRSEHDFRRQLSSGRADSALLRFSVAPAKSRLPKDDLLRVLFEGVAAHYAGDYTRSAAAFDRAHLLTDDRTTKSLSRAVMSVAVNDWSLAYEPTRTERLLLPYYSALTYVRAGRLENAAVEARRLSALLQKYEDSGNAPDKQLHAFFRYFAGVVFEAAGENADADVAFRNAYALDALSLPSRRSAMSSDSGDIVVLVEHGFAPHRVQESLMVNLGGDEERRLRDDDDEERSLAEGALTDRLLAFANTVGPRTGQPRQSTHWVPAPTAVKSAQDKPKCDSACKANGDDDDDSYLLRVSWPVMYAPSLAPPRAQLTASAATSSAQFQARLDDAVLADFREEQKVIVARAVARAVAKYALTKSAEKSAGKKHEALGSVFGFLSNMHGVFTEQADTRSWHLLPASISMVRMRVACGSQPLSVDVDGQKIELGTLEVKPAGLTVVATRAW